MEKHDWKKKGPKIIHYIPYLEDSFKQAREALFNNQFLKYREENGTDIKRHEKAHFVYFMSEQQIDMTLSDYIEVTKVY